jgi:ribosomal protein S11
MVFFFLFIYIGSGSILGKGVSDHKGIKLLIAVAAFIFIILQGWYPIILALGELWFVVIPIIFLWYFVMRHFGKGGGMPGGGMSGAGGGLWGLFKKRAWNEATGFRGDYEKSLNAALNSMAAMVEKMEHSHGADDVDAVYRAFSERADAADRLLKELRGLQSIKGVKIGKGFDKALKRYNDISEEMQKKYSRKKGSKDYKRQQFRRAA